MAPLLRPAAERFQSQLDWLDSWHSFSFSSHYDPAWMGFGPLRVIKDDTIAAGRGFGMHPHRDMEIITVMVEGDDMNEPIADAVRGILDGHVVLTRALATANHFPAIDVLESVSRLNRDLCPENELRVAAQARDLLALYRRNEDLITIGAYTRGANPKLDQAIDRREALTEFLKQPMEQSASRREAWDRMGSIVR